MRRRRVLVAAIALPWVLWALVRTLGLDAGYPLVAMIAFTPYAAASAPIPLVVALVAREWAVAAVALLALAALAVAVVPRAFGEGTQPEPGTRPARTLVVMTANLRFGNADARAVLQLARANDVDVLSLQELTPEIVRRLDDAGARELLPSRVLVPRARAAGTGLMARRPLRELQRPVPDGRAQLRVALELPGGEELGLVAVHPFPPVSRPSERAWHEVLRALPDGGEAGRPHVLLGDFNATLDHRELRRVLERGYTDAAAATGDGLHTTWPVGRAYPPITLDHVLASDTIGVRSLTVHKIKGSDHRALIAELAIPVG